MSTDKQVFILPLYFYGIHAEIGTYQTQRRSILCSHGIISVQVIRLIECITSTSVKGRILFIQQSGKLISSVTVNNFRTISNHNHLLTPITFFFSFFNVFSPIDIQGGSNMTGTNCDLFTHKSSRSYLNHLVFHSFIILVQYTQLHFKTAFIPLLSINLNISLSLSL
jgi:hypothetical protein